jgi:ribosomal-protein-alanine N-acetyltransferase
MSAVLRSLPRFEPMRGADLARVSSIETSIYEFPWTRGNFQDSMSAGYSCWACRLDEELVGYAVLMIAAGEAHLLNISIAAPWQGHGLGATFLAFLIDLARERYCERILLEVRASNALARALYERIGFVRVGVRKGYYPARVGREDAIVLEHRL